MENEPYDYRQYDQIWRRVAPQENPYPEVRRNAMNTPRTGGNAAASSPGNASRSATNGGRTEGNTFRTGTDTPRTEMPRGSMGAMSPPTGGEAVAGAAARALLREELRHMGEVLRLLENALA